MFANQKFANSRKTHNSILAIKTGPMVVEFASGKGHALLTLINTKDSVHDFSVKFSPCALVLLAKV